MGILSQASFDPIFFHHHCFVDYNFYQWELANPNATYPSLATGNMSDSDGTFLGSIMISDFSGWNRDTTRLLTSTSDGSNDSDDIIDDFESISSGINDVDSNSSSIINDFNFNNCDIDDDCDADISSIDTKNMFSEPQLFLILHNIPSSPQESDVKVVVNGVEVATAMQFGMDGPMIGMLSTVYMHIPSEKIQDLIVAANITTVENHIPQNARIFRHHNGVILNEIPLPRMTLDWASV